MYDPSFVSCALLFHHQLQGILDKWMDDSQCFTSALADLTKDAIRKTLGMSHPVVSDAFYVYKKSIASAVDRMLETMAKATVTATGTAIRHMPYYTDASVPERQREKVKQEVSDRAMTALRDEFIAAARHFSEEIWDATRELAKAFVSLLVRPPLQSVTS